MTSQENEEMTAVKIVIQDLLELVDKLKKNADWPYRYDELISIFLKNHGTIVTGLEIAIDLLSQLGEEEVKFTILGTKPTQRPNIHTK